ncbi:MAG: hypothetical protein ASUL_08454 [Candidatus Aramenus sulfurataquae]|uniref:EamA domain-containing protein n=1 Tax=Candidatus Aramenus sulfurataquae TaxID=1326980 RepID=W7KHB2_9CREN|nr:MAG: hypothetical protein ASUL_08454 [Candidatus Aramenus sulfurataquae]
MRLKKGFIDLVLSSFFWGTIGIATEFFYERHANAFSLVLFRSVTATVIVIFLVKAKRIVNKWLALMGLVASVFYVTYIYTITVDGPSLSAVLLYTAPLWVFLISRATEGSKASPIKLVTATLVVVGLYLIYEGTPNLVETLLGMASGLTYALLIVYSRLLQLKGFNDWEIIASQSLWSLPFVSFSLAYPVTLSSVIGGIYLGVFATVIPYFFFYRGMRSTDSITASIITALEPVFTIIMTLVIFEQGLNPLQWVGTALILGSVVINGFS